MKKKKLKLSDLKVQSFVTFVNENEKATVQGGSHLQVCAVITGNMCRDTLSPLCRIVITPIQESVLNPCVSFRGGLAGCSGDRPC